jgi:hypothetical protein
VVDPKAHKTVGKCWLCNDNKVVDTEKICKCGRPVSRVVNKVMICTLMMCEKRANETKHEDKKEPTKYVSTNTPEELREMYGVN